MTDTQMAAPDQPGSDPVDISGFLLVPGPYHDAQPQPEPLRRWVWAAMDREDRETRLMELTGWVDWLVKTFELHNAIPPCWYRHSPVIEHLTALYLAWVRTYAGPTGGLSPHAEIEWIQALHHLLPTMARPACQSGAHEEPPTHADPDGEDMEDWVTSEPTWLAAPAYHPALAEAARMAEDAAQAGTG